MTDTEKTITVDATMENLDIVTGFIETELDKAECPMKTIMQIIVSLEEIYVNVVNYAYEDGVGTCEITFALTEDNEARRGAITIKDHGKPFNPLEKEDPDITLSVDERQIGGLGIYMVKKSMDEVTYKNISGCNILTIVKKWNT